MMKKTLPKPKQTGRLLLVRSSQRIFQLIFLMLTVLCLQVSANGYSQKVTLKEKNSSLQSILEKVKNQTGYQFFYSDDVLRSAKKITVTIQNKDLAEALDICLEGQGISYTISEKTIILKKVETPEVKYTPVTVSAFAEITGKVMDETGQPLSGATVQVKGTTNGTSTDADGNFKINAKAGDILVISYVGFVTTEVKVGANNNISVALLSAAKTGDEVVVVGYGTQKKSDVTGSVAKVDVERATAVATVNVAEMLRGQASGVQITQGDNRPGGTSNIIIRGQNSIRGGNEPLIVLDGVPIPNLNDINPDDIASIEVLKDASAQAIYGARASNGVVLVTSKRGKAGKMTVNYHGYFTTQKLTKNFDLYSPLEFAQLKREAERTTNNGTYLDDDVIFTDFELDALKTGKFVDWEKEILKPSKLMSHSLSINGGNQQTKVYGNFTYFDQDGLIPSSGFQRGSFRFNIDQKISDRANVQANIYMLTGEQDRESSSLDFITISPLARIRDSLGNLTRFPLGPNSLKTNPLYNIQESTNEQKSNSYSANLVGNYKLLPGLSYKLNSLFTRGLTDVGTYVTRLHPQGITPQGRAVVGNSLREEFLIENILRYDKNINANNRIDLTAVQSVNEINFSQTTTTGTTFANDLLGYDGITDAINKNTVRNEERRRIVSFMGRAGYSLNNKYLLTLTGRFDGSSVFAQSKKWAFFPAAAFAWKMHEEGFLKNVSAINEMKLKVSYGSVGNQALNPYSTLGTVSSFPYVFNGVTVGGNIPDDVLPNPNLTWETSTTFNTAVDFALFKNRVRGSVEYYNTHTTDLLVDVSLGGGTGYSSTITNGGESKNSGVELLIAGDVIRRPGFNWTLTTIWTRNRNELIKSGIVDENGNPKDDVGRQRFIGKSLNVINQKKFDGIFQTQEEIDKSAQATQTGIAPGSIRVVDINGDGMIDDKDNVVTREDPDWYGSISSNFEYKGFELFADFYIVEGATKSNGYLSTFENGGTLQGNLNGIKVPYWTPENPSTTFPRPQNSTPSNLFALAVKDASYTRLRTLTLGYNLSRSLLSRIKVNAFKVYFTANNVFTITDYKSYSPEVNPNAFPDAKTYTFGVRFSAKNICI